MRERLQKWCGVFMVVSPSQIRVVNRRGRLEVESLPSGGWFTKGIRRNRAGARGRSGGGQRTGMAKNKTAAMRAVVTAAHSGAEL